MIGWPNHSFKADLTPTLELIMKTLRPWFTACFFWAPLLIALLLNPGHNASNIQHFSFAALLVLAACGVSMLFYGFIGLIQLNAFSFAYATRPFAPSRLFVPLFALALGSIGIYSAWQGF